MKTILSTLLLTTLFIFGNTQQTLAQQPTTQNYVVLTKKVAQLKPILLAASVLKVEDGDHFGKFEIIVCGKEIGELTNREALKPHLENAEKLGAEIIACGFSLQKFKVDRNLLPKEMKVVDNGILYNFELQKQGYLSLSL